VSVRRAATRRSAVGCLRQAGDGEALGEVVILQEDS